MRNRRFRLFIGTRGGNALRGLTLASFRPWPDSTIENKQIGVRLGPIANRPQVNNLPHRTALHFFQSEVPVLNLHRPTHMHLDADESFKLPARRIVVDHRAHQMSIQYVHEHVAADNQMI